MEKIKKTIKRLAKEYGGTKEAILRLELEILAAKVQKAMIQKDLVALEGKRGKDETKYNWV